MTEQKEYSFSLSPGRKKRHVAGRYDCEKHQPRYEIEISSPDHVRNQIEVKDILLGSPENCHWAWEINNKSSWIVFVTVKKDGIKV